MNFAWYTESMRKLGIGVNAFKNGVAELSQIGVNKSIGFFGDHGFGRARENSMTRPIAIDLFAGAGGLSLGFEQAGFDIAAAVEIDPIHAAVHAYNFPQTAVLCRDISTVSGQDVRDAAGIGSRKVDVVMGGPPCQGFSLIGQRALDDPRNMLVREFVRLVCELNARYFVFENVKGLTLGRQRLFLEEVVRSFEERGYNVRTPWRVLNAAEYGVPQDRERLILLGARKGLKLPDYPKARTWPAGTLSLEGLKEGPSCEDALGDLPDADSYESLWNSDEVKLSKRAWGRPSKYAASLRCASKGAWHFGHRRAWSPDVLTSSMRTSHTEISRRRFTETEAGKVEPISRFFKLPAHGVANTLRAGTDGARGAFTSPRPIHYRFPRCITVREMARLHGFPDWFRLHETKWHGARQIGNAVAPPLAFELGSALLAASGVVPKRSRAIMTLGNPNLLRMNMSEASEYWGVVKPITRRDRKSGAKKRRQHEIEAALSRRVLVAAE
jgi:DNA (cytosine-5)-methyltransferase 1